MITAELKYDLQGLDPRRWNTTLLEVVLAATMVLIVSFGFAEPIFKIASQLTIFAFIIRPALIRNPVIWFGLAAIATISLILTWTSADNHKYLFVYWLWVVFFAVAVRNEPLAERVLRSNARFFLVFVFLLAALQKVLSPSYMSGEMFAIKLLADNRLEAFARLLGVDPGLFSSAKVAFVQLKSPLTEFVENTILVPSTEYVSTLAIWITWYDLLIQIAIGVLFAIRRQFTDILGHVCLLFFIFTTYIPAPVFGFGWTLAIYGFATTKGRFPRFATTYVVAFIAILLYQLPWRAWVTYW
jgi:hypothetical protein